MGAAEAHRGLGQVGAAEAHREQTGGWGRWGPRRFLLRFESTDEGQSGLSLREPFRSQMLRDL